MMLHDHRPLTLNTDDYQRTCRIPHKKVFVVRFDKVDVFIYINIHLHIHTHTCTHKHIWYMYGTVWYVCVYVCRYVCIMYVCVFFLPTWLSHQTNLKTGGELQESSWCNCWGRQQSCTWSYNGEDFTSIRKTFGI